VTAVSLGALHPPPLFIPVFLGREGCGHFPVYNWDWVPQEMLSFAYYEAVCPIPLATRECYPPPMMSPFLVRRATAKSAVRVPVPIVILLARMPMLLDHMSMVCRWTLWMRQTEMVAA